MPIDTKLLTLLILSNSSLLQKLKCNDILVKKVLPNIRLPKFWVHMVYIRVIYNEEYFLLINLKHFILLWETYILVRA